MSLINREELIRQIYVCIQPDILDIEIAKQIILEQLYNNSEATFEPIGSSGLLSSVTSRKQSLDYTKLSENWFEPSVKEQLVNFKAELTGRESLLSLHATGVLIAYGQLLAAADGFSAIKRELIISYPNRQETICSISFPSVHLAYRLSAPFRGGQTFRLASGYNYLDSLNQEQFPSRAKRCLRECIDAFRYGLYLSATMSVGAASESLWMKLSSLVCDKKPSATTELAKQLKKNTPSIVAVIDETWRVLGSNFDATLDQVFSNRTERKTFREHADRLCDRRNYAMHSEEADEDEPYFTRNETGMMLLDSINYFRKLTELIAVLESLPSN